MARQSKALREHDTRLSFFSDFASADLDNLDLSFDPGKPLSPAQTRAFQLSIWFYKAIFRGDLRAHMGAGELAVAMAMGRSRAVALST